VEGSPAGRVTVTNVARGAFCSGSLGYWVAADRTGRGVATAAVLEVLDECFTRHGLHRLEAGTLVDNHASQAVLRRTGFTLIGRAPGLPAHRRRVARPPALPAAGPTHAPDVLHPRQV
jgi:ribosomal-protein-alanine N-acetyltransferase